MALRYGRPGLFRQPDPLADFTLDEDLAGIPLEPGMDLAGAGPDERINDYLGIEPPDLMPEDTASFEADPLDLFLERLGSRGLPQGLQQPRGFLQGLVSGAAGSLISQGQRTAERRKKFDVQQAERSKERNAANLQATRDYRNQRAAATRERVKEMREGSREKEKFNRENPPLTASLLESAPWLGRMFQPGENIPKDVYQGVIKNMSPEAVAEMERKRRDEAREEKKLGMEAEKLGLQREELGLKKAEAAKPGGGKPLTESQSKDVVFSAMGRNAIANIQRPLKVKGKAWPSVEDYFANNPAAQFELRAPNLARSPEARAYAQAIGEFAQAFNRKLSGGAVTPEEWKAAARDYFAQPGDDPATVRQKARSREVFLASMEGVLPANARGAAGNPEYGEYLKLRGGASGRP